MKTRELHQSIKLSFNLDILYMFFFGWAFMQEFWLPGALFGLIFTFLNLSYLGETYYKCIKRWKDYKQTYTVSQPDLVFIVIVINAAFLWCVAITKLNYVVELKLLCLIGYLLFFNLLLRHSLRRV